MDLAQFEEDSEVMRDRYVRSIREDDDIALIIIARRMLIPSHFRLSRAINQTLERGSVERAAPGRRMHDQTYLATSINRADQSKDQHRYYHDTLAPVRYSLHPVSISLAAGN